MFSLDNCRQLKMWLWNWLKIAWTRATSLSVFSCVHVCVCVCLSMCVCVYVWVCILVKASHLTLCIRQQSPSLDHPSVANEAWYWAKRILRCGWLCITSRPIYFLERCGLDVCMCDACVMHVYGACVCVCMCVYISEFMHVYIHVCASTPCTFTRHLCLSSSSVVACLMYSMLCYLWIRNCSPFVAGVLLGT